MRSKDIMLCSAAEIEQERERVAKDESLAPEVRRRRMRFLASLAEIVGAYEKPFRAEEWEAERIRWEDWVTLRREAVEYAGQEIRRRRWRGSRGGLLPEGSGAEDIADDAITEVLASRARLALGWTRERLLEELKRLMRQRVRVLHGRREAGGTRSEWEAGRRKARGEVSVFEEMADGKAVEPRKALEAAEEKQALREEILGFLNGEAQLKEVFGCVWEGLRSSGEIAKRLGLEEAEVVRVRRRLGRKLREFQAAKRSG